MVPIYASEKLISIFQNYTVTETVHKVADSFKCKPIEGMLSHQLKQFKIDGEKTIIQNPNEAQRKEHEKCEFELHEVYAIDVLVSSGEGIVRLPKKICSCRWISKFSFIFFFRVAKRTRKFRFTRKRRRIIN